MKLRGIDFGPVWAASGAMGFFGEGYWYHQWIPGLNFRGCTFVAKTTTLNPRPGNMPMREDGVTPQERKPKCIIVKPWEGVALNAVGLSGPGAKVLFEDGRWQARREPFFLSFMSLGQTFHERLAELRAFLKLLERHLPDFHAPIGLQLNFSCPNVEHHLTSELYEEVSVSLGTANKLRIPLVPKLNALVSLETTRRIAALPACDALCISNTIPWGQLPEKIDWKGLFGMDESPLASLGFGNGGLSGRPLLPIVADWIRRARVEGVHVPINAGGGILDPKDVDVLKEAGANSVFLGSMAFLRGWRVQRTIRRAHQIFPKPDLPVLVSSVA